MENKPNESIIDKHCLGCWYYAKICESIYCCSYLDREDKRRPCPPGKNCTVRKEKMGYKPRPQNTKEPKKRIQKNEIWVTHNGETKPLKEWAKIIGMDRGTLYNRIKIMGWSAERAIETPKIHPGKRKEGGTEDG